MSFSPLLYICFLSLQDPANDNHNRNRICCIYHLQLPFFWRGTFDNPTGDACIETLTCICMHQWQAEASSRAYKCLYMSLYSNQVYFGIKSMHGLFLSDKACNKQTMMHTAVSATWEDALCTYWVMVLKIHPMGENYMFASKVQQRWWWYMTILLILNCLPGYAMSQTI